MDNNSSNGRLSKPVNIYHEEVVDEPKVDEVVPEVTTIEVKQEDIKVNAIEEPKVEKKISPSQIRFNPNPTNFKPYKPKNKGLLKIAWMGFTGQEMDASEQRKFDNIVIGDGRALLFCIIFAFCAFSFLTNSSIGSEQYKEGKEKNNDFFNRCINYFVDKYKKSNKSNTPQINTTNTVVLDSTTIDTSTVTATPAIDTLIDETRDASKGFEEDIEPVVEKPKAEPVVVEQPKPQPVIEQPKSFSKDNLARYYDSVLKSKHH